MEQHWAEVSSLINYGQHMIDAMLPDGLLCYAARYALILAITWVFVCIGSITIYDATYYPFSKISSSSSTW